MNVLSIDIGGTNVKYGFFKVLDKDNVELQNFSFFKTPKDFNEFVLRIEECTKHTAFDVVSVAIPGVYDFIKDEIIYAPNIQFLDGIKIKTSFNEMLRCDVLVENDGNLAALGEYFFVEKSSIRDFVLVTLGTGVGGGVIFDGKILSGKTTISEIGHITINFNGRKCGCGKMGCFEAYCGMGGLIETYKEVSGLYVSKADEIFKKCSNKDVLAKISVDIFAYHLASGLVSIANIFAPEIIKIGGGLSFSSNLYYRKTIRYFSKMIFPAFKTKTKLSIAELRNNAGIYGGVALALMSCSLKKT
ncbi:MAG: ROK family protein [Calditerrivibrio sp.]|nr:ROK family protein [Calditerrivibrio sp.]